MPRAVYRSGSSHKAQFIAGPYPPAGGKWRTKVSCTISPKPASDSHKIEIARPAKPKTKGLALKLIFLLYSGVCNRQQSKLRAYDAFGSFCRVLGQTEMHYRLSFLDETGHVRELCKSEFETDGTAILWMQVVGARAGSAFRLVYDGVAVPPALCRACPGSSSQARLEIQLTVLAKPIVLTPKDEAFRRCIMGAALLLVAPNSGSGRHRHA